MSGETIAADAVGEDEATETAGVELLEAAAAVDAAARDERTLSELDPAQREEILDTSGAEGRHDGLRIVSLSANFKLSEFHCRDGTHVPGASLPALRRLVTEVLQPLRDQFGIGYIVSGYRHRAYNDRIGGARHSRHIYDDRPAVAAADVIFASGNPRIWAREAEQLLGSRSGIGRYAKFVHLDNDPTAVRRW